MSDMNDLEKKIGKIPVIFRELAEKNPELHDKILALDNLIWDDGALSRQTKKVIAISIAAALRDEHAVQAQIAGAKKLGVKNKRLKAGWDETYLTRILCGV